MVQKPEIVGTTDSTIMVDYATIQVRRETKRLLEEAKRPGESFDRTIRRTLKESEAAQAQDFLRDVNRILSDRKSMKPLR